MDPEIFTTDLAFRKFQIRVRFILFKYSFEIDMKFKQNVPVFTYRCWLIYSSIYIRLSWHLQVIPHLWPGSEFNPDPQHWAIDS
jgi:hypothetical protein